jgi:hypothetical protein
MAMQTDVKAMVDRVAPPFLQSTRKAAAHPSMW